MKSRFTFQPLYHLLILDTFQQAQGMKTNSAVSCLFTIDFYQGCVRVVTYLLLSDGRARTSETRQNIHPDLQQVTTQNECPKPARRAREGSAASAAPSDRCLQA